MAKKYVGPNSLMALVSLVKQNLKLKVDTANIANDLETTDPNKVLGASQAKAILDKAGADVKKEITTLDEKFTQSIQDVDSKVTSLTTNSMSKETYDADDDGVIDKAKKAEDADTLGGVAASKFAQLDDNGAVSKAKSSADSDKLGGVAASQYVQKNSDGQIDSSLLPSYVDDVVDGYYHNGSFYKNNHEDGSWPEEDKIKGETGKIYVDVLTTTSYRYSGTSFAQIVSSDMVEVTADEVNTLWTAEVSA